MSDHSTLVCKDLYAREETEIWPRHFSLSSLDFVVCSCAQGGSGGCQKMWQDMTWEQGQNSYSETPKDYRETQKLN